MGKFEQEKAIVTKILEKDTITHEDRIQLLKIYQVPFHDSGKIENLYSCDSSCGNCSFCQKIREEGKDNPLLICNYCYDNEQEKRWVNVKNRHGLQLLIISSVLFAEEELATLKISGLCRFNSSGDIENVTMARNYIRIAKSHPSVYFGLFAKNTLPVVIATDTEGKPGNCKYIQSSPIIGKRLNKLAPYFDIQFVVYPDEEITTMAINDGAGSCNGKKCMECGYKCYLPESMGGWKTGADVAEVLRLKDKKAMAKILETYYRK